MGVLVNALHIWRATNDPKKQNKAWGVIFFTIERKPRIQKNTAIISITTHIPEITCNLQTLKIPLFLKQEYFNWEKIFLCGLMKKKKSDAPNIANFKFL